MLNKNKQANDSTSRTMSIFCASKFEIMYYDTVCKGYISSNNANLELLVYFKPAIGEKFLVKERSIFDKAYLQFPK